MLVGTLPSGPRSQVFGKEGLDPLPGIGCRRRLRSRMGQLRHWPEQQRAIRLVVQKAVAGRGIDLDIMWYVVSAQSLSQRGTLLTVRSLPP